MSTFALEFANPVAAVAIPFIAALAMLFLGKRGRLVAGVTAGVALAALVSALQPTIRAGGVPAVTLLYLPGGLSLALAVDRLGLIFAMVASYLWVLSAFYTSGYMRSTEGGTSRRFSVCFAVAIGAAIGVATSANLLTLYLFYELLSLSTYPLVTHKGDAESMRSGRKYLAYLLGASILLALPAMVWIYHVTGTLDFRPGGLLGEASAGSVRAIVPMLVFGFAKCALMPLHGWLPSAMVAPTPVSALLHAVAVVKVGVFSVLRSLHWIVGGNALESSGAGQAIVWFAAGTILLASLLALVQDELKRMLAYSTVGQLAYIVLGAALVSPSATRGAVLHIAMHAFGKITLFFCAGAIYVATGKKKISQLDGLGWRMPFTMTAFFVGSLSIIGLPPLGGLRSKWLLGTGALEAGQPWVLGVLLVSSFLGAAYLLPVTMRAFFAPAPEDEETGFHEAPLVCVLPLLLTAALSLVLFFYPDPFLLTPGETP